MDVLLSQLVAGLSVGSVLLLVAVGLSLTFGQMGVINMAHGEFIMVGAYTAFVVQGILGAAGLSLLVSIPAAFLIGGVLGVILEQVLIRHMYHRPLDTLLATFGVGLILQQVARDIFGAPAVDVRAPEWLRGSLEVAGVIIPQSRLFILALVIVVVAALGLFMTATPMGRRIRAVVLNRDLAETNGIDTRATDRLTFFIGSGLAGVAGVTITLIGATGPTIGANYIVDAFLVVAAGGIGKIKGAVIAAFALGVSQAFIEYSTSASIAKFLVLVLVVAFLQFRPQGLFTVRTRSLA
ncbi:urea ABC transporter permease subunit UrtB [Corynebacterium xerosis]|uniref:Urea ABC transporter permease subunit UrtB n=1 Tax=Corynebacterium xerosis TaxID=1725 RepID=A0A2N6SXP2_9CORY|nr:urea ABC transporter permease subunit UrtB [Corynebacterium xerosis]PMC61821.1 urea ABC transporter permease subunit UrtB [Corynebacterium xerosis]QGS34351.1 urea ABC transporter permease subunit UrtB [Corynebacterium xerosis]